MFVGLDLHKIFGDAGRIIFFSWKDETQTTNSGRVDLFWSFVGSS